ncbi:YMGG-like glycine zipper-containing protein [Chitinophaga nivalis]|uniref:YMGG-like glycine zipper-containing protein n=1 Tax=Chitinophaga nivalis TaxID=2991709 RepID=A0ABT3IK28_9BACT|nr:YMGG-like glycine zipper-containing protein [Chitinophaga nivalis]MCW3465987.1 YMGG-like glycine zipper-containing protein [Chitinophaga nivalis]MCW3484322.1 YMGG-like glycine zipper-containing protein [Chitinophaga nivalis]
MKQLSVALAATVILFSCQQHTDTATAVENAKRATIDSMNAINTVKQQVIDSMNAIKDNKDTRNHFSTAGTNNYYNSRHNHTTAPQGNSSEVSQPAAVATATPAPAPAVKKKKGWSHTAKGALVGAGAGAITGAFLNKDRAKGAIIGSLIGAGTGAATGAIIDHQKKKKQNAQYR